jgi:hypothetical protein
MRSSLRRCPRSGSFVTVMPPSPKPPRFLLGKNEKQPISPIEPAFRRCASNAPMACAASSITGMPRSRAAASIGSMSATLPYKCTGISAFVLAVIAATAADASMLYVTGSMSTNTGVAPSRAITPAVAKNEYVVVTTSSPGPMSSAISAASSASVPDDMPMACFTLL